MKKLLSLILALTMGLGLTLPAHAADCRPTPRRSLSATRPPPPPTNSLRRRRPPMRPWPG